MFFFLADHEVLNDGVVLETHTHPDAGKVDVTHPEGEADGEGEPNEEEEPDTEDDAAQTMLQLGILDMWVDRVQGAVDELSML